MTDHCGPNKPCLRGRATGYADCSYQPAAWGPYGPTEFAWWCNKLGGFPHRRRTPVDEPRSLASAAMPVLASIWRRDSEPPTADAGAQTGQSGNSAAQTSQRNPAGQDPADGG